MGKMFWQVLFFVAFIDIIIFNIGYFFAMGYSMGGGCACG